MSRLWMITAQTLNDPKAGTTVFLCALLLAGAIGAAAVPGKRPALKADRALTAQEEWAERRMAEERAATPDEGEVATFAERWDAMRPEFQTGQVEIVDAVTEPVLMFPRRARVAESEQELVTPSEPSPVRRKREARREARADRRERPDVCERHGLSKTWTGRYRWRCR
jgi:hypothetical protein